MPINLKNISKEKEELLAKIYGTKTQGVELLVDSMLQLRLYTLNELKGKFTREELIGIIDLYNGTIFEPRFSCSNTFLIAQLEDGEKYQNQSKRFNYNYDKLIKKVQNLTSGQVLILLTEINHFWNAGMNLEKFVKELLP